MWRSTSGNESPPDGAARDPHARRTNALREDAFLGRHASLLNAGTDAHGQPKLFDLWSTFPWHLQKESSLLALHFGSVGLFFILLVLQALVSVWPLAACIAADNVQQNFTLFHLSDGEYVPGESCPKPQKVSTFASKMSPGNFCNDEGNSSTFFCSTVCNVNYDRSTLPPSQEPPRCLGRCPPETQDVLSPGCCDLQKVEDIEDVRVPPAFLWLWCVGATFIFCVWMFVLQHLQHGFAEAGNVKNINMAQYAVLLSNVGGADCEDHSLKEFARRYGDVVSAFHIRNYGRFLTPTRQLQQRLELAVELERIEEEQKPPPALPGTAPIQLPGRFDSRFSRLLLFAYKRILCLHLSTWRKRQVIADTEEACRERIAARTRERDSSTGNAIIIFNSVASVANMLHDHNWRNRLASALFPPEWGRAFNIVTDGLFARTPKITLQVSHGSRVQHKRRHVTVRRAPEPSDIWWDNTLYGGWRVIARRVVAWALYILLLCVALAVQTVLAVLAKIEADNNKKGDVGRQGDEEKGALSTVVLWKYTIGKAIATMLFSGLGTVLCLVITDIELYLTSTQHTGSMVVKLTVFNLLNGFVVPMIAIAWSGSDGDGKDGIGDDRGMRLWFAPGGLVDIALLVQLSNVVVPNFLALFRFLDMLAYHFLSRMACSKLYACNFLHPPAFRLNQRLPGAIYTLGLSILYTPVLPISPLIGAVALIVQYAVDQYIALRHSSKPRSFQVEALAAVNYVVRLLPLVQIAVVWVLFHEGESNVAVPAAMGVVIWVAAAVTPALHTVRQRHFKRWVEGGRPLLLQWAKEPGEKQPTWTHHKQQTCTMSVVSDVPAGIRFNYDTYLPDCVALDPGIFTQNVKPHFYHHNPAIPHAPPQDGPTASPTRLIYQNVRPSLAVTQALQSLHPVEPPADVAHTCNFRPQDLQEGPALENPGGGPVWWPRLFRRGSSVEQMAVGLDAIGEHDGDPDGANGQSPTFVPPTAVIFDSIDTDGGVTTVSATGRQIYVPGGLSAETDTADSRPEFHVPDAGPGGRRSAPAYPASRPMSLESK